MTVDALVMLVGEQFQMSFESDHPSDEYRFEWSKYWRDQAIPVRASATLRRAVDGSRSCVSMYVE